MNEAEFDRLIKGYLNNTLSDREKELVDKWLESMGRRDKPVEWPDEDRVRLKTKLMQQISSREAGHINIVGYVRNVRGSAWLRAAAAILLPLVIVLLLWQWKGNAPGVASLEGGQKKIIMDDGTIVWVKDNTTKLDYPEKFEGDIRLVKLEGEALFEVAKDARHPFVIQCGEAFVKVKGTSFNMKSDEEEVEVVVLTGIVHLASTEHQQSVDIQAMQKVVYYRDDQTMVQTEVNEQERIAFIEGTSYNMRFPDTKMREIIPRIEEKYDVTIQLLDEEIRDRRLTADFTDESLENTLNMIDGMLTIRHSIHEEDHTVKLWK